ncbi:ankyrin repeat and socs box protein [Anaeramoeba flamelloides]|uniref:Ankyrin repeat and socs box protein n=1 Tax=Anaeramoeba flamelloides TaxID=1746091 RepID=A0ABQ8YAZ8_9EUKA|nr:ankyrin repeat and socs box protein [Anaeramoeba flamelloides]
MTTNTDNGNDRKKPKKRSFSLKRSRSRSIHKAKTTKINSTNKPKEENEDNLGKKAIKITSTEFGVQTFYFFEDVACKTVLETICEKQGYSKKKTNKSILILTTPQIRWPLEVMEEPMKLFDFDHSLKKGLFVTIRKKKKLEKINLRVHFFENSKKTEMQFTIGYDSQVENLLYKISTKKHTDQANLQIECHFDRKKPKILAYNTYLIDVFREYLVVEGFKIVAKIKTNQENIKDSLYSSSVSEKETSTSDVDDISSDDLLNFFENENSNDSKSEKMETKKKKKNKRKRKKKNRKKKKKNNKKKKKNKKKNNNKNKNKKKKKTKKKIYEKNVIEDNGEKEMKKQEDEHKEIEIENEKKKEIEKDIEIGLETRLGSENETKRTERSRIKERMKKALPKPPTIPKKLLQQTKSMKKTKKVPRPLPKTPSTKKAQPEKDDDLKLDLSLTTNPKNKSSEIQTILSPKNKENVTKKNIYRRFSTRFRKKKIIKNKEKYDNTNSNTFSNEEKENNVDQEKEGTIINNNELIKENIQSLQKINHNEIIINKNDKDNDKTINNKETIIINSTSTTDNEQENHKNNGNINSNKKEKEDYSNKMSYSFPRKYQFSREKVEFQLFNRNIMDYIVESNTKYLQNIGFFMDPQGMLQKIQKNIGILEMIKLEMEDIGSNFNKHLSKIKSVVEDQISSFFLFSIPFICNLYKFKGKQFKSDNLEEIENLIKKKKGQINNENQSEALALIKDLQSMKQFSNSPDKGVLDLIKQDLGVYWFNTNNDLEMSNGRPPSATHFGFKFSSKPIKNGNLDTKTGVLSKKAPFYFSMTQNFLHYFKLEKNKPQDLEEKIKNRELKKSLPLSILDISNASSVNISLSQEKEQSSFRIAYETSHIDVFPNSELEKENWERMIGLMKSRLHIQKLIQINAVLPKYPWSYAIIFHSNDLELGPTDFEAGLYSFDIRCLNSMWNIKKTFPEFIEFRHELNKMFPKKNKNKNNFKTNKNNTNNSMKKQMLIKQRILFVDAFIKEILSDLDISQSKTVRSFFQMDNVYNAIVMEDMELMKLTIDLDQEACIKLTKDGNNILHFAIEKGCNQEIIQLILEYFPDLYNKLNPQKISPLLLAAGLGQVETLKTFSKFESINLNFLHNKTQGMSAFLYSAQCSQLGTMKFLVESNAATINQQQTFSLNSALHLAINNENFEMAKYLLQAGIDIELKDSKLLTALHYAIKSQNLQIMELLLDNNCKVNSIDNEGRTSLHICAQTGNHENLQTLIYTNKCKIDRLDNYNRNALFYAIDINSVECAKILIERGIDTNTYDYLGFNAIHFAVKKGSAKIVNYFEKNVNRKEIDASKPTKKLNYPIHTATIKGKIPIINFLLKYEIEINARNQQGNTALHIAIINSKLDVIKILAKQKNINTMIVNNNNHYPLFLTSKLNMQTIAIDIAYLLLEKNADIDSRNGKLQRTALQQAIINKKYKLARFLVEMGAKSTIRDSQGETALHSCCCKIKNNSLTRYLVQRGCDPFFGDKNQKSVIDLIFNIKLKKNLKKDWENYKKRTEKRKNSLPSNPNSNLNHNPNSNSNSNSNSTQEKPNHFIKINYFPENFEKQSILQKPTKFTCRTLNSIDDLKLAIAQKFGLKAINNLHLVAFTSLSEIYSEVKTNLENPNILTKLSLQLNSLSIERSNHFQILKIGILDLLLQIISKYPTNSRLISTIVGVLNNCTLDKSIQQYLGQETQTFPILLSLLSNDDLGIKILTRVILLLWNLIQNEQNANKFAELEGVQDLIDIMKEFPRSLEIQYRGLGALLALSSKVSTSYIMMRSGCISVILNLMKTYATNQEVITRSINVLYNLAANKTNSLIMGKTLIPKQIIALLKNEIKKNNFPLISRCLIFLANFSSNETNKKDLASNGVVPILLAILLKYKDKENIITTNLIILNNLLSLKESKLIFAQNKGLEIFILLITKQSLTTPLIQKKIATILVSLTFDDTLQNDLIRVKVIATLLNLVKNNDNLNVDLLLSLIICISNLLLIDKCKNEIIQSNSIEIFLQLTKNYLKTPLIIEKISLFFLNSSCDINAIKRLIQNNGKETFDLLLKLYPNNPQIVKRIKGALNNISYNNNNF